MSDYQLEDNVELPPKASRGKSGTSKYPFADMQPGQSFVVPEDKSTAIRSALTAYRKNNKGVTFATRVVPEGVRIWRME